MKSKLNAYSTKKLQKNLLRAMVPHRIALKNNIVIAFIFSNLGKNQNNQNIIQLKTISRTHSARLFMLFVTVWSVLYSNVWLVPSSIHLECISICRCRPYWHWAILVDDINVNQQCIDRVYALGVISDIWKILSCATWFA